MTGLILPARLPWADPRHRPVRSVGCGIVGRNVAERVRSASLSIYIACAAYALTRGIIIADTKFEFGVNEKGRSR